jgi:hypothetical protein
VEHQGGTENTADGREYRQYRIDRRHRTLLLNGWAERRRERESVAAVGVHQRTGQLTVRRESAGHRVQPAAKPRVTSRHVSHGARARRRPAAVCHGPRSPHEQPGSNFRCRERLYHGTPPDGQTLLTGPEV